MTDDKLKILGSAGVAPLLLLLDSRHPEQVEIEPHLSRADNTTGAVAAPVPSVLIPGIPPGFQPKFVPPLPRTDRAWRRRKFSATIKF